MKENSHRKSAPRLQDHRSEGSADLSLREQRQQWGAGQDQNDELSSTNDGSSKAATHTRNTENDSAESPSRRRNVLFWIMVSSAISLTLDIIIFNETARDPEPGRAIDYILGSLPMIMVLWKYEVSELFRKSHSEQSKEDGSLARASSEDE